MKEIIKRLIKEGYLIPKPTLHGFPKLRILDFLITFSDFDYAMKEIAQKSGVGYSTLRALWPELITGKIVIQTRTIGKAKLYQLNTDNQLVKSFERFIGMLLNISLDNAIQNSKR